MAMFDYDPSCSYDSVYQVCCSQTCSHTHQSEPDLFYHDEVIHNEYQHGGESSVFSETFRNLDRFIETDEILMSSDPYQGESAYNTTYYNHNNSTTPESSLSVSSSVVKIACQPEICVVLMTVHLTRSRSSCVPRRQLVVGPQHGDAGCFACRIVFSHRKVSTELLQKQYSSWQCLSNFCTTTPKPTF